MLNKRSIYLILLGILLIQTASADILSDCSATAISSPGYYELDRSVTSANTCLTIATSNVEIDCKGNSINYSDTGTATRFGIDVVLGVTPLYNITVRNCNILRPTNSSTAGYGIRMQRTSNSFIINNNITTNGTTNNYGVYLLSSCSSNLIENNSILATGSSTGNIGLYMISDSNENIIRGNTIKTFGTTTGYGIFSSTDSNDNIIINNL